jgi:dTDP-4-amino-4,6-dideoxygalactose transaminase
LEPNDLVQAQLKACERVIKSGWYILGKELENFENIWAQTCSMPYAAGVANGMDALEIALRALNVGPGDEVITTGMTAFATVLAILRAGATPVLADIDPCTANLCLKSVENCLNKKTKAIVLVHLYGQISNMDEWLAFVNKRNLYLIEDCAQSHLARWKGQPAGSFGIINTFSFYPTKNLGALGDAGAIVTKDSGLYEKVCRLRNYGQARRYYHTEVGLNSRLDEIQAAILLERLKWLESFTVSRQKNAQLFSEKIDNPFIKKMQSPKKLENHVYHLFVLHSKYREELMVYLKENNIESFIHYPVPVHCQELPVQIQIDPKGLPHTEEHAKTCLSIPCHPFLSEKSLETIISVLNSFRPV